MNSKIPQRCPACASDMHVCALQCPSCKTEIQGDFEQDAFALLTQENRSFLETFIRCRGSLKDVGAALGISYPTARNRLDSLITALDFNNQSAARVFRLDVLGRLKNGEITAEEALLLLQGGKNDE